MRDRSPAQDERAALLFELLKVARISETYVQAGQSDGAVWLHFTDWYGFLDLPKLEELNLLTRSEYQFYNPVGDWRDDFPPVAYSLSSQALLMLAYPGQWVAFGLFTQQQKDNVLARLKKRLEAMPMYSQRLPPFRDDDVQS